jgi:hypothetical protein
MTRVASYVLIAALVLPPALPAAAAPPRFASSAEERSEVSVTVYNDNLGLVREIRDVTLGQGEVRLEFQDVASTIQPETVTVRPLGRGRLGVLEQNYRYDLLSPQKLLEKYVGRSVRVHRWNEKLGREEATDAKVLSIHGGTVLEIDGEITFGHPGRLSFPQIPENLIAEPTLEWLLRSEQPRQRLEVSYLAGGMSWQADYILRLDEKDERGHLTGWITLRNGSGASYENAQLKLVAGDVRRAPPVSDIAVAQTRALGYAVAERQLKQEGFFEYQLYTLERPTTLLDNQTKQVALLEADAVKVTKRFVSEGQPRFYRTAYRDQRGPKKVGVQVEFENSESNALGKPLPRGVVRVYKADSEGSEQFVGEDRIDHTPRDEDVRLKVGEAFDLVVERRQTDYRALGKCGSESAWQVELRNHKDESVEVEVLEHAGGDWELVSASHEAEKEDAFSFRFRAPVPARGEAVVDYRVRVRWC